MNELPRTVKIEKVIDEAKGIRSFILPGKLDASPGQFVMVWLPGVDMKPIAISYLEIDFFGVTISSVGKWSEAVCRLKKGDLLGYLGPYGTPFKLSGQNIVLVGGGYGTASLMVLAEKAKLEKINVTIIVGARNKDYILYVERIKKLGIKVAFTTDDGSYGEKGYNTEVLSKILDQEKVDKVYACGPEMMEKKIVEICTEKGIDCEISIERYMKCGFGVCGACCMDKTGKRACVEGTVFSGEEALAMEEFGKFHRDGSATKHEF